MLISLSAFVTKIDLLWPEAVVLSQALTRIMEGRATFSISEEEDVQLLLEDGPVKQECYSDWQTHLSPFSLK